MNFYLNESKKTYYQNFCDEDKHQREICNFKNLYENEEKFLYQLYVFNMGSQVKQNKLNQAQQSGDINKDQNN